MGCSYDPAYEKWEFGKLSALREVALAVEGAYQYYYMGMYGVLPLAKSSVLT